MYRPNQLEWDINSARHLLSRTLMTFNKTDVDFALSMSLDDFVENYLLKVLPEPTAPADWADAIPEALNGPHNDVYLEELKIWYLKLLNNHSYSFQERMMLFLHNHFTTEARKAFQIQRIYQQSKLLRSYVFGDFKQLTKEITIDPAMLVYLDGATNTKNSVNENYSRELLELFTIGIGNYTQEDIKQGALALTGWKVPDNSLSSAFDPKYYHGGKITYLGKTGTLGYSEIVDIIFEQPATANFICSKLCLEFISPKPQPVFVEELAQIFIENNYQLRPVLAHMFKSPYFFHEDHRATKVKNPAEFVFSTLRLFNLEVKNFSTLKNFLLRQDQELFNPPDVKGWRGQRKWINATTYAIRNAFVYMLLYGKDLSANDYDPVIDVIAFGQTFDSHNDAVRFIDDLCEYIYHYPVSHERKTFLLDFLTEGNDPSYWTIDSENAADSLRKCIHSALTFPEFQLH